MLELQPKGKSWVVQTIEKRPDSKDVYPQGKHTLMKSRDNGLLRLIAIFKLVKAATLIAVGFGALHLIHDNNAVDAMTHWAGKFGFNPEAATSITPLPR